MKTNNNKINMSAAASVKEVAAKEESIKAASRLVRECPEGRNQFTRVFETADGEKAAVLYPVPVNVKKDGKWEAVDNRLRVSADGKAFENGSAVLKVRLAGDGRAEELRLWKKMASACPGDSVKTERQRWKTSKQAQCPLKWR